MMAKFVLPLLAIGGVALSVYSVIELKKMPAPPEPLQRPVSRPAMSGSAPMMTIATVSDAQADRESSAADAKPAAPNANATANANAYIEATPSQKRMAELSKRISQGRMIAGAGLLEARQENIIVGTPVSGVVVEVSARVGVHVKEGDPLFRLDDRSLKADIAVAEAKLKAAEAQWRRLKAMPRPEDLPPAKAAVEEAQARLRDAEAAASRSTDLRNRNMIPVSDYDKDRFALQAVKATLLRAKSDLERIQAGAWAEDIAIAEAEVARARSEVDKWRVELDRLTIRALADGEVLQVNVRPGQFAAQAWREPMVVLGNLDRFHVRIDIDEHDLHRFRSESKAIATLKGRPLDQFELELVKVEPYVIPKRSLTGDTGERVDTRVLQVVYAIKNPSTIPIYVGQQMDAYIEAGS